jgi:hypothetical protein
VPELAAQVGVRADDGDPAVGDEPRGPLVVLGPGGQVVQAELQELGVGEARVHVVNEGRARVRIGEAVPAGRHEAHRGAGDLPPEPLFDDEFQLAGGKGRGNRLADRIGAGDERRRVPAGVVGAHGTITAGHGTDVHFERDSDRLGQIHRQECVVDAQLVHSIVVTLCVREGPRGHDGGGRHHRIPIGEIELAPWTGDHARVFERPRKLRNDRRGVKDRAALTRRGVRPIVHANLHGHQKISMEVEHQLFRLGGVNAERQ